MPPKTKQDASKKTVQKKKQQSIEDKTFGLKNKNKSKKIMQFVQSVERNVMNSGDPAVRKAEEARKKAREDSKLRKKLLKDEQDALFSEALLAVQKKKASTALSSGKVEAKGRDGDDGDDANKKSGTSRAMKMMFQMDAQEMNDKLREDPNYVPTLEDEIELLRSKLVQDLKRDGKTGTPVTPETFAVWQDKKKKARAETAAKKVEAELKKKKGGKGLSVLSGRDLYEYKRELFSKMDDEGEDMALPSRNQTTNDVDVDVDDVTTTTQTNGTRAVVGVQQLAEQVQSDLFLQGTDDDLDDIDDD